MNVVRCDKSEGCIPDPKAFFCIAASIADLATVNLNCIKMLLANWLSTFFIKGKPVLNNAS